MEGMRILERVGVVEGRIEREVDEKRKRKLER